ncbi:MULTISPECIES: hypothetical protein [Clostridium]|uniref:hypothetical protein n=1 Tax=Clostridium TaxID=1485 RepID=UPI0006C260E3|nr:MULTISPECIES: hypothetical protein [Clostridium]MDU7454256.1 hypothetical protein [Clostridium saudiense]CUO04861.1 membrane-spanning protein [Clostridium disporicum]SCJ99411.1 Uncharacterised protein [uncultured Clostridium sp.]
MKKKINWQKLLSYFVLITLISTTIFLIFEINDAPTVADSTESFVRLKSDYALMLSQCILGIVAMLLPGMLENKFKIAIPSYMLILYTIFLYAAIYLGEVRSFYYNVPNWDNILHTFSGAMIGALGFSIVTLLNKTEKVPIVLSPLFVALFSFCFAVTLGVIWEFYEFTFDGILGLNMQKFALENGTQLIGRAALTDTMVDLFVDAVGAFIMSVIGYISLRYNKGWIEKLQVRSTRK